MSLRLVNLGLPKSGTTTLATALARAGWRVADHKLRRGQTDDPAQIGRFVAEQLYDGYFARRRPFARLDPWFDALTEISALRGPLSLWPQCDYAMIRAMRDSAPDLLFVATWRKAGAISTSMCHWNSLGDSRLPAASVPGLPHGYGTTEAERLRWIRGHYAMLRDIFGDDPRYLELNMAGKGARDRLATHIGQDLPWWGRVNTRAEREAS